MEKITIEIKSFSRLQVELTNYPELTAANRLAVKSLAIVKRYTPGILNYLSKQKVLAHLKDYLIEIYAPAGMDEAQVRHRLGHWMRSKKVKRLTYVIIELLLMPFSAFIALLPGPNVAFYLLFVLFYFHLKAFLSLRKLRSDDLNITLLKNGTETRNS